MSTEVRHVQHWDMTIRRGDGDERWEDETRVYPSGAQKFRPQLIHVKISEDGSYRASLSGPRILKRGPVGEELTRRYGLPSWVIQIIQRERELHGLTGPMERPDEP